MLNPVRAGTVRQPADWLWSSYRPTIGLTEKPNFLTTDWVLGVFGDDRQKAVSEYQCFVAAAKHASSPWQDLKNQLYLGSERFVEHMQARIGTGRRVDPP